MPKRPDLWWSVYRAVFQKLHPGCPTSDGFSSKAMEVADAAFDALSLPKFVVKK